ncbi:MAG: hypothetical protein R2761_00900 [Acidimicrobiales bacterium]
MLRSSSAVPKVGVALAALVPLGFAFVALRSDGDPPDDARLATADATTTTAAAASLTGAPVQQIGLPVADESVAVSPYQAPPATAAPPGPPVLPPAPAPGAPPAVAATGHGHGDGAAATSAKTDMPVATSAPVTTVAPTAPADQAHGGGTHGGGGADTTAPAATATTQPAAAQPMADDATADHAMGGMTGGVLETHGYNVHDFTSHVIATLGEQMLAPGQQQYGGYERNGNVITARSPITGLRPVAEQAIAQMKKAHPDLTGVELEAEIAQQLTNLNDWEDLRPRTQEKMMILSGIDIASLDGDVREKAINHLQHSPLPFGDITEVLTPDVTIDLGYTHTLDKEWTIAEDQGNGVFKITLVSNNDNGSHSGHILGSFRVQTPEGTSVRRAKRIGNEMVRNENNNDELLLDEAVKKILYGETPPLDYSQMTPEQKLAAYAGKGLPTA